MTRADEEREAEMLRLADVHPENATERERFLFGRLADCHAEIALLIARDQEQVAANEEAQTEIVTLKQDVIAFCAPWAASYAKDAGYPAGHLHPVHYDILARCGARMTDVIRHPIAE